MDFFFCIPILIGCSTKVHPDGQQTQRICPRCNNAAVFSAKSRTWFELCWVPLVPLKSKHVWICGICQWSVPVQPGWEPAVPSFGFQPGYHGQQSYQHPPQQPGYAPVHLPPK